MIGSKIILDEIRQIILRQGNRNLENFEDERRKELFRDLASASLDLERDKNFNPRRVTGTCEWFLHDARFQDWRKSSSSGLFRVSAGPGCGKSVLSRTLVDEGWLSPNVTTSTVCYFFFKDGDEIRSRSENALCAILHQIFSDDPEDRLIEYALDSHNRLGQQLTRNFSELWKILEACAADPQAREIVILLDALDECSRDSSETLIDKLDEYNGKTQRVPESDSKFKLKFFITGRAYDYLEAPLAGS